MTDRPTSDQSLLNSDPMQQKNQVMESLYKRKNANAHFQQLSVTHDMTKMKDLKSRKKVEEAKQKEREEETGEYIWRVRGAPGSLKVVRLRKRQ